MANVITIKRDYIMDVLPDTNRENRVAIDWFVLNNSNMVKLMGYSSSEMENFKSMMASDNGNLHEAAWFENFFDFYLLHNLPINSKENRIYTKDRNLRDNEAATIIFTPNLKETHEALEKLLKNRYTGYDIMVLNGDETTNANAEERARSLVRDHYNNYGNYNVIFISSTMGNRSFSVPEIKNVVLFVDGASEASVTQKIARGLTPWECNHCNCKVVDFRFEYDEPCLSNYLSGQATDTLSSTATHTSIQQVLDILMASDKLTFNEYFTGGVNPIRKLTKDEVSIMLHSSTYTRERALKIIYSDIENISFPVRCNLNEEFDLGVLVNNNIKGDGNKKVIVKTNSKTTKAQKKDIEKDSRIQHLLFLLNHFAAFVSCKYNSNLLENEFRNNMPETRKMALENKYGIDMNTMAQIAEMLISNSVNLDSIYND